VADACGLGGDQGIEVDDIEQGGFDQLRMQDGTLNPEQWLVRENRAAFGDGVNIQREPKVCQIAQKPFLKERIIVFRAKAGEIVDFVRSESEVLQPLQCRLKARGDGVASLEWKTAEE
jgi:hypothetical protein